MEGKHILYMTMLVFLLASVYTEPVDVIKCKLETFAYKT